MALLLPADCQALGFPAADVVFAGVLGLPPADDAIAAPLPAASAAVTAAPAAIILVRLRIWILLGFGGMHPNGTRRDSGRPKRFLTAA